MTDDDTKLVSAAREIDAEAAAIFELIADPAAQPRWDGNDNLAAAHPGQRVHKVGDVFETVLTHDGAVRENHVVEFEEARVVAWMPSEQGSSCPGHLWRWELEPLDGDRTRVTHTYDWTRLVDESRFSYARDVSSDRLRASLDRLAEAAEENGNSR